MTAAIPRSKFSAAEPERFSCAADLNLANTIPPCSRCTNRPLLALASTLHASGLPFRNLP